MRGATGNIYCGLSDYQDMAFLLHYLRDDDLFVDVGANVGTYTVLASAVVGADTVAVEPGQGALRGLSDNIRLNSIDNKVEVHAVAAGRGRSDVGFSRDLGQTNHVILGSGAETPSSRLVSVVSLTELLAGRVPALIKIDVEGYESEVMWGAESVLSEPRVEAVLLELNGLGSRLGVTDEELHERMVDYGYKAYRYSPRDRVLLPRGIDRHPEATSDNVLYVRNLDSVQARVRQAGSFQVLDDRI